MSASRQPRRRRKAPPTRRPKGKRECPTGKRRYRDHQQAIRGLHAIEAMPGQDPRTLPVRAYHCPTCNGWHLTSKEKWP